MTYRRTTSITFEMEKHHIIFAPKYRQQIIMERLKIKVGVDKIVKRVDTLEAECHPNLLYML